MIINVGGKHCNTKHVESIQHCIKSDLGLKSHAGLLKKKLSTNNNLLFCYVSIQAKNMSSAILLREHDYSPSLKQPRLPEHLDGDIHLLEFNSDRWYAAAWFFSLLDELQCAHDTNPHAPGGGFIFSKKEVLEAWYEHRLFGLWVSDTVLSSKRYSIEDPFVMTRTLFGGVKYILPIFCIVDAAGALQAHNPPAQNTGKNNGCIQCLWVAERARNIGLGQRLVAELNCYAVQNPIVPIFWRKMGYTIDPSKDDFLRDASTSNHIVTHQNNTVL